VASKPEVHKIYFQIYKFIEIFNCRETHSYLIYFIPEYLSSSLLFRNVKVKIERKINLLIALYVCGNASFVLTE